MDPIEQKAHAALANGEWIQHQDPNTGRPYFYNPRTQGTTWDLLAKFREEETAGETTNSNAAAGGGSVSPRPRTAALKSTANSAAVTSTDDDSDAHASRRAQIEHAFQKRRQQQLQSGSRGTAAGSLIPSATTTTTHGTDTREGVAATAAVAQNRPLPVMDTYRARLIRFYQKWEPSKVGKVNEFLIRFEGREEEMFHHLVQRYGPEPEPNVTGDGGVVVTSTTTAGTSSAGEGSSGGFSTNQDMRIRDRLVRFYNHYDPEQVQYVDEYVPKFREHGEDLWKLLIQKYGPEPGKGARGPGEYITDTRGSAALLRPDEEEDDIPNDLTQEETREVMIKYYEKNAPDKISSLDDFLHKYVGKEKKMLEAMKRKYGAVPGGWPPAVAERVEARKAAKRALAEQEAREAEAERERYARAAQGDSSEEDEENNPTLDIKRIMMLYYKKYDPEKLPAINSFMKKYEGQEVIVLEAMQKKYGPVPLDVVLTDDEEAEAARHFKVSDDDEHEPSGAGGAHHHHTDPATLREGTIAGGGGGATTTTDHHGDGGVEVEEDLTHRDRLVRLFQYYAPERLSQVDDMLIKGAGKEEELITTFVKHLGPEPPRRKIKKYVSHGSHPRPQSAGLVGAGTSGGDTETPAKAIKDEAKGSVENPAETEEDKKQQRRREPILERPLMSYKQKQIIPPPGKEEPMETKHMYYNRAVEQFSLDVELGFQHPSEGLQWDDILEIDDEELMDRIFDLESENALLLHELSRLEETLEQVSDNTKLVTSAGGGEMDTQRTAAATPQPSEMLPPPKEQQSSMKTTTNNNKDLSQEAVDDLWMKSPQILQRLTTLVSVEHDAKLKAEEELTLHALKQWKRKKDKLAKSREATTQTADLLFDGKNLGPLVAPVTKITDQLESCVALSNSFRHHIPEKYHRYRIFKPEGSQNSFVGIPRLFFETNYTSESLFCVRGAAMQNQAFIPVECYCSTTHFWAVSRFPVRSLIFWANFMQVPDSSFIVNIFWGQFTDQFAKIAGNNSGGQLAYPIGLGPARTLESCFDNLNLTQHDVKSFFYRSMTIDTMHQRANKTVGPAIQFNFISEDDEQHSILQNGLHNVLTRNYKEMGQPLSERIRGRNNLPDPGMPRHNDVIPKYRKACALTTDFYPAVAGLTVDELNFCQNYYVHPHIFLNFRMKILQDPDRFWISYPEFVAPFVHPSNGGVLPNLATIEAMIKLFEDKRWIKPVDIIQVLDPK